MGNEKHRPSRETLARLKSLNQMIETGSALLQEFDLLGVQTLEELASSNAKDLYQRLCQAKGVQLDSSFETLIQRAIDRAQAEQTEGGGSARKPLKTPRQEPNTEKISERWQRH